jgi:hypothetical protein
MRFTERTLESGLILTEHRMDQAALERQLKRRDPLLSLQGWPSETHRTILWKVVRDAGSGRPPDTVCVWQSERGEPYPLSSALLDLVDQLDRNSRSSYLTDNQRNEQRRRELARKVELDNEAIRDDTTFKHGRPVLPRSQSLRMARDKKRNRGEKV